VADGERAVLGPDSLESRLGKESHLPLDDPKSPRADRKPRFSIRFAPGIMVKLMNVSTVHMCYNSHDSQAKFVGTSQISIEQYTQVFAT